jgi:hypothetical protein
MNKWHGWLVQRRGRKEGDFTRFYSEMATDDGLKLLPCCYSVKEKILFC